MRNMLVIGLSILLGIAGCSECNRHISSSESIECQRLRVLWERAGEENPQIIFPETETESGDEMTWQELGEIVFFTVGCCFCKSHPVAKEWMECNRLECIWEHLENEQIHRIAFYKHVMEENSKRPEDWHPWAEITEPERIKEVMKQLCIAMKKSSDRFANDEYVMSGLDRMQIITDKHKFIIPISRYREAVYGIGWTSYELRKQLRDWGFFDSR